MTICKEQFISALREAVSAEFENIPKSENAIEFSFSNAFNKKNAKAYQITEKLLLEFN